MAVTYLKDERIFKLDTRNTSYIIGIVDEENFIGHIYFGEKIKDANVSYLLRTKESPFVPSKNNRDRTSFLDAFPMEYPGSGNGDFRDGCISVLTKEGHVAVGITYESHNIYRGKKPLEGLPATFADEKECKTLELVCKDKALNLKVILTYTAFEDLDVITRSVKIINENTTDIYLTKVLSTCVDMDNEDYEMLTLHGSWARERVMEYRKVGHGFMGVQSFRGESSHQDHPFFALKAKNATNEAGNVYGFHFVYSGNFLGQVEMNQFDSIRAVMGIHPQNFKFKLAQAEAFQAPEVVMVFSAQGVDHLTHTYHDLYRNHLIRSPYKDRKRPILINNWEATYFDFDTQKLLSIAKDAAEHGIEMLVMDDGWFGHRNDDNTSLGDWDVNEKKLQGGLKHLVDEVNKLGLKFGIWFEPEMISPESDLYKAHPDWAIAIPNRTPALSRNQYVLDLTRRDVLEHTYESVAKILRSANIAYVKWDMNRQLTDIGSALLPSDQQGEIYHRYVLAVYELQERLIKEFPELLLENCSGGGARFDPGMLYYSPQIWCSDDTDAIERLSIQEGTSLIYPLSTMGAHISDCPNHALGRVTPFETRGIVALAGTFGYELDITKISEEDRKMIPEQVAMYHKYNDLVRNGDYYRIASYRENHYFDCYEVVSKDQSEALVTFVQVLNRVNYHSRKIRIKGLEKTAYYRLEIENEEKKEAVTKKDSEKELIYSGEALMKAGFLIQNPWGDFKARLFHFTKCEEVKRNNK